MSKNAIEREVHFGFLPSLRRDRHFSLMDFILVQTGFGIAAWCFLVGGLTGTVLEGKYALWVILFGNAIPVLLILPIAKFLARSGLDTFIGSVAALGHRGAQVFFAIFAILNLGWITIALFMLGESAIKIAGHVGLPEFLTTRTTGAPIYAIIAFAASFSIAYAGPIAIKWFTRIGVPAILLILVGLIVVVVGKYGFTKVFESAPVAPYDDFRRSVMSSLEWNVGLGFSWLPYFGQWVRLARSESGAINGTFLGYGLLLNVAGVFGAFTALLVGSLDPTDWMISVGGTAFGLVGLVLLVLANLTSAVVLMYSQALSLKTVFPRASWFKSLATVLPAGFLMLSPAFYDAYGSFLAYVSFIMATFGGILVADYLMRSGKVEIGALYDRGNKHYQYWKGFNPAAVVALAVGTLFYWWTYNPVTDTPGPLFGYLAAGIPSFFVSAIVYYAAAKTVFSSVYARDREWRARLAAGEDTAVMLDPAEVYPGLVTAAASEGEA